MVRKLTKLPNKINTLTTQHSATAAAVAPIAMSGPAMMVSKVSMSHPPAGKRGLCILRLVPDTQHRLAGQPGFPRHL